MIKASECGKKSILKSRWDGGEKTIGQMTMFLSSVKFWVAFEKESCFMKSAKISWKLYSFYEENSCFAFKRE